MIVIYNKKAFFPKKYENRTELKPLHAVCTVSLHISGAVLSTPPQLSPDVVSYATGTVYEIGEFPYSPEL